MPTRRQIPPVVLDAAAVDVYERTALPVRECRDIAGYAIDAALTEALPGLYVTKYRGDLEVWRDTGDPDRPHAVTDLELRQAVAALLPDRTQEG